ncbi:unnamed protein product [marine sediment metagenome]|uniref:Uncharacterized protein n=1 Tax=marine sediment metagenome TaxID=412755 RepID=X1NB46_9ZZZZ
MEKTKCKYAYVYNQPPCYRSPFDELMGLGFRTKHLVDFVGDDREDLALKELEEIRGILDKVEAKIREYMSEEAEG